MNRLYDILLFTLVSFIFIILQSTLFSPKHLGVFFPDLNLILVVFLGLFSEVRGGAIIALGNGFMMDVLSGNVIGLYSLSRLSLYLILRGLSTHIYTQSRLTQASALFFSTLFSWCFIWIGLKIRTDFRISLGDIMAQSFVNTLTGIPLFLIIHKLYARVQG
ncbi:MAG TPA: rod shape-determining protein MreD [Thermodesulfobacteriota bacterium]